jgi:iron complex outermembrane recepter protein
MPCFLKFRTTAIGVAVASILSVPALAQEAPKTAQSTSSRQILDEVIVTGTHIRSEDATWLTRPITVIDSADIERFGAQGLTRALREEPAFSGGSYNGGSGGYFSGGTNDLNLRGIGSQYTLVLVNGRPFTNNIANIPASAVRRIDILKDGGSSVYGSDSVAGVVNVILDTAETEGLEVQATYGSRLGMSGSSGYDSMTAVRFGAVGERARFVTNIGFRKRGGTKLVDMELGRTANLDLPNTYSTPANIWLPSGENVILDYTRFGYGDYSTDPADYIPYDPLDYNRTVGMAERSKLNDRSPQEAISSFSYGEFSLTEDAKLFTELFYSHTKQSEENKNWGVDFYGDSHLDFGPVPATNPYNPFGEDLRDVFYGLPELGGVKYDTQLTTYRIVSGAKGRIGRYSYEIGLTYMRDEHGEQLYNQYSDSGLQAAINRPGPDALNPFCFGCNTPEQLAGIRVSNDLGSIAETTLFDAQLSGNLIDREHYDVDFAVGVEKRRDNYRYHVDPLTATGDIYYQQFSAYSDYSRQKSAFGELVYHLDQSAGIPAIYDLTLQLSARTEWLDADTTTDPHLSVSWHPISDAFMLRASYGTSYVPPPLYLKTSEQYTINYVLAYPDGSFLPTDVIEGGNPDLQPEKATSINFGLAWAPTALPGSTLSLDYFRIRQDDVVLVPNPQDIIDGLYPGEIDFSGPRPRIEAFATNAGSRTVEGIDFGLDLQYATQGAGTFGFRTHGSLMTTFEVDNGAGTQSRLGKFSNFVFVSTSYGNFGSLPRLRAVGGPYWTNEARDFTTRLTVNYTDGYEDGPGTNRDVGAFVTYDVNVDYDLSRIVPGLTVSAGVLNLSAEEPPYVAAYRNLFVVYDPALSNSLGRQGFISLKYGFQ